MGRHPYVSGLTALVTAIGASFLIASCGSRTPLGSSAAEGTGAGGGAPACSAAGATCAAASDCCDGVCNGGV